MDINSISKVYFDPSCMINYSSYYILGFWTLFGKDNCAFCNKPFELIKPISYNDYRNGINIIIETKNGDKKLAFIDFNDKNTVNEDIKMKSDLYAKINIPKDIDDTTLFPIGPSFAIKLWNPLYVGIKSIINYNRASKRFSSDIKYKYFLRDYLYINYRRKNFSYYLNSESDESYCFSLNTLWYDDGTDKTTNTYRRWFVEEANKLYTDFDGGFFYIDGAEKEYPKYSQYKEMYKGLILHKRISMNEYLKKIKRSAIVFNTPSVCGCHGWKLCEFLAMGKAIISTPLTNIMPGNFKAGNNYLEVNSKEEIHDAIVFFQKHPDKRLEMEKNNKEYFNDFLSPEAVVKRIIKQL